MTLIEALAETAAQGKMSQPEVQEALAILLRDHISREGTGAVVRSQDELPTRPNPNPPQKNGRT